MFKLQNSDLNKVNMMYKHYSGILPKRSMSDELLALLMRDLMEHLKYEHELDPAMIGQVECEIRVSFYTEKKVIP